MNNDVHALDQSLRRRLQYQPDGTPVLIEDAPGIQMQVVGGSEPVDLTHLPDATWRQAKKALPSHDIVFDNATKTVKFIRKRAAAKAKQEPQQ